MIPLGWGWGMIVGGAENSGSFFARSENTNPFTPACNTHVQQTIMWWFIVGREGNLRKNKYMCERLMVRLRREGREAGALGEAPPSLRFARPRPAPSPRSSLAVFEI